MKGEEEERIRTDARKRAGSAVEVVRQKEEPSGQLFVSIQGHWESKKRQRYEDQQSSHQGVRLR